MKNIESVSFSECWCKAPVAAICLAALVAKPAPFVQNSPEPVLIVPFQFRNKMRGESHGLEISANCIPIRRWTLGPGYAFERLHLRVDPGSTDHILFLVAEAGSPDHSAQFRSHWDLGHALSWDAPLIS